MSIERRSRIGSCSSVRDVLEQDAGLREVGHVADRGLQRSICASRFIRGLLLSGRGSRCRRAARSPRARPSVTSEKAGPSRSRASRSASACVAALGDHLDRAVGAVAREARHAERAGLAQHEVPVADALHAALHEIAIRGHVASCLRAGDYHSRARPPAATHALDHAHWKLKPPMRPSTSSISPARKRPGRTPRLHRARVDLGERHAARRRLGEGVAARLPRPAADATTRAATSAPPVLAAEPAERRLRRRGPLPRTNASATARRQRARRARARRRAAGSRPRARAARARATRTACRARSSPRAPGLAALESRAQPRARDVEDHRAAHAEVRPEERARAPREDAPPPADRQLGLVRDARQARVERARRAASGTRAGVVGTTEWPERRSRSQALAVAAGLRQREPAGREHDPRGRAARPASCGGGSRPSRGSTVEHALARRAARSPAGAPRRAARRGRRASGSRPGRASRRSSSCSATPISRKNATVSADAERPQHAAHEVPGAAVEVRPPSRRRS